MDEFKHYLNYINNCNRDQPLISETKLGQRLDSIPLSQIQPKVLTKLCQDLNLEQLITTKQGLARDYRGLAELMGFSILDIETYIKKSSNPTRSTIEAFIYKKCNIDRNQKSVTLNDLIRMIEQIERFDVIDDFIPDMIRIATQPNCSIYSPHERNKAIDSADLPIVDLESSVTSITALLTIDDTRQQMRTCYDAFVCYAPEDYKHAESLIFHLEQHGKTIATSSDLLPGNFEHDSLIQLIDSRCRKVITVLTPNFLKSKECDFQTKFANEIGIKAGSPKIIPVLFEACDEMSLPPLIRVISKIDLTNSQSRTWQLNKLLSSLAPTLDIPVDQSRCHQRSPRTHRQEQSPDFNATVHSNTNGSTSHEQLDRESVLNGIDATRNSPSNVDPVVELMHSEVSDTSLGELQGVSSSSDKEHSSKPLNWLKQKLRRATSGSQSMTTRSSSSRAGLLSDTSSELISEECTSMNMRT